MGLYDTVKVEMPLPDAEVQGLDFQTKDLGCDLDCYTLKVNGRLVKDAEPHALRGFSIYTSVGDTWYEYFVHLDSDGKAERIERVYVGPTKELW